MELNRLVERYPADPSGEARLHLCVTQPVLPPPPPSTFSATTPTYTQCNPPTHCAPRLTSHSSMRVRHRAVDTVRLRARGPVTGFTRPVLHPVSALQRRCPASRCRSGLSMPTRSAACRVWVWWPTCLTCSMPCGRMLSLSSGAFCALWSGRY